MDEARKLVNISDQMSIAEAHKHYEKYRDDFDRYRENANFHSMDWWTYARRTVWDDLHSLERTFEELNEGAINDWHLVRAEVEARLARLDRTYAGAIQPLND